MKFSRIMHASLAFGLSMGGGLYQVQAAELGLAEIPLFLKDGVDPNMIVTLDDSGSMAWGYVPDSYGNSSGERNSRRFKSSEYNAMYYNPAILYVPPKDANGNSYSTSFTNAYEHGFVTGKGTRNLSNNYRVTHSFDPSGSPSLALHPTGRSYSETTVGGITYPASSEYSSSYDNNGIPAYYYVFDSGRSSCNGTIFDDDCFHLVYVGTVNGRFDVDNDGDMDGDDEKQNFANWYSFYRVRVLATASAASLAFQAVDENVRVAFQNLHKCNGFDSSCRDYRNSSSHQYDSRIANFTGTHRSNFYEWLAYAPASGGTPLRSATIRAGDLLTRTDKYGAYAQYPRTSVGTEFACRPSFHIAMTDGIWNSDSISSYGNADSTARTLPDGTSYTSRAPFQDTSSNSVADIAFDQWATDARTDIDNEVPTYMPDSSGTETQNYWNARNDPATWQHMTTFTLSLGLSDVLTNPQFDGDTFGGEYADIVAGTKTWPNVGSNDSDNPYDLWHAAINGRGKFFGATDPNSLVNAFTSIIAGIQERERSAASVALDSAIVNGLQYAYHASFDSAAWFGNLRAFELDPDSFAANPSPVWNANTKLRSVNYTTRNIKMAQGGSLVDFTWANLTSAQQALLNLDVSNNPDSLGASRVNYLRGDSTNESSTGFRPRNGNKLGDIVHSAPVYVGAPNRLGYDALEGLTESDANSYATFKTTWANRRGLVYVGANDGMLHAFNAETGVEEFAFVPTAVMENLRHLTYPGYTHQVYVDGPITVGDIYDGTKWRTILVGSFRNGAKGLYALDVTDPDNIELLWERQSGGNMGYVYSRPEIVRLHNGEWGIVFGNGYNSDNHQAVLFILDPADGSNMKVLNTGVGSVADSNGLAKASVVDLNGDLIVDYVYAGDLHGNLWRFDLTDPSDDDTSTAQYEPVTGTLTDPARNNAPASTWSIGYGGNPVFTATDGATPTPNRQPITSNVVVVPHNTGKGVIALVGTGKYLEDADAGANTSTFQSYYGIWDRYVMGHTTGTPSTVSRSSLLQQKLSVGSTVTFEDLDTDGTTVLDSVDEEVRIVTENAIQWYTYSGTPTTATLNHQGWYIDFNEYSVNATTLEPTGSPTNRGELLATDAVFVNGLAVFATSVPNDDPCEAGVDRWVWALDAQSGKRTQLSAFDLNNDGLIDQEDSGPNDAIYNSTKVEGYGAPAAVGQFIYLNKDTSTVQDILFGKNTGRQTWRKVR